MKYAKSQSKSDLQRNALTYDALIDNNKTIDVQSLHNTNVFNFFILVWVKRWVVSQMPCLLLPLLPFFAAHRPVQLTPTFSGALPAFMQRSNRSYGLSFSSRSSSEFDGLLFPRLFLLPGPHADLDFWSSTLQRCTARYLSTSFAGSSRECFLSKCW